MNPADYRVAHACSPSTGEVKVGFRIAKNLKTVTVSATYYQASQGSIAQSCLKKKKQANNDAKINTKFKK